MDEFLHEISYACEAIVDYECDRSHDLEGVSKNHVDGKTNADVIHFEFEVESKIDVIPKNIDNFFPNIEVFKCPMCTISRVSSDDLKHFPKLKCFYLGHNKLTTIPGDLFKHTPNVEFIGLEFNQIEQVGAEFFSYFKNLKLLYFDNNVCSTTQFSVVSEIEKEITEKCTNHRKCLKINENENSKAENLSRKNRQTKSKSSRNFQIIDSEKCEKTYMMLWPDHSHEN